MYIIIFIFTSIWKSIKNPFDLEMWIFRFLQGPARIWNAIINGLRKKKIQNDFLFFEHQEHLLAKSGILGKRPYWIGKMKWTTTTKYCQFTFNIVFAVWLNFNACQYVCFRIFLFNLHFYLFFFSSPFWYFDNSDTMMTGLANGVGIWNIGLVTKRKADTNQNAANLF